MFDFVFVIVLVDDIEGEWFVYVYVGVVVDWV